MRRSEGAWRPVVLLLASTAVLLSGCTTGTVPDPTASVTAPPTISPSATASASAAPELDANGTADDNRAFFDAVNSSFLASNAMPGGRPIIDNLVAAGFDKTTMQVTPDATSIGSAVDSVQFSVRFGDRCLVGRTSTAAGYVGTVGPAVDGGNCLVGTTRVIDW